MRVRPPRRRGPRARACARSTPARRDSNWDAYVPSTVARATPAAAASGGASVPKVGLRVRHGTYGLGIVRSVEGVTQDAKVTVEFANRQTKKFVLKFANLEYMG